MDRADIDFVQQVTDVKMQAAVQHFTSVLLATFASIGQSLVNKDLFTPQDFAALATLTADRCSQNIGAMPPWTMTDIIDAALRSYVDGLLSFAELGLPSVSGDEP